ncbi:MAG: hypothetical protein ABSE54_04930 [Smithella sp.]|jgi:hypothetical protein
MRTDSAGFRNDRDYHGQKYVLVGDSFVAGVADQSEIIGAILRRDYNVDTYNLAVSGMGILDYMRMIKAFRERHGAEFRAVVFIFEGNDFDAFQEVPYNTQLDEFIHFSRLPKVAQMYLSLLNRTSADMRTMIKLIEKRRKTGERLCPGDVTVRNIVGRNMGFLNSYIDVTKREHYQFPSDVEHALRSERASISHIFFIPEKYRIYAQYDGASKLPNAQWDCLKSLAVSLRIPCHNLTEPLVAASKKLIEKQQFTYWTDDSHLNVRGNTVVAAETARVLKEAN